jgi:hypothetical protein
VKVVNCYIITPLFFGITIETFNVKLDKPA